MRSARPVHVRIDLDGIVVDNFAGGGGASEGIEQAIGYAIEAAINHDPKALAMYRANHPETRLFCEDVFKVAPVEVTRGRRVALGWFSPDCTHHSKAKGGKPRSKKIRGLAWVVVKWAATVRPRVIMLENVEEFAKWGPLLPSGQPDPKRSGFTFRRWWRELEKLGYRLESRELKACDFGAPTSRKRLFIVARCDGQPIRWPEPTHGPGREEPYRTAAECIDFGLPCPSIFGRKRPLAENTLRRIGAGMRRYVFECADPFVIPVTHQGDVRAHSIREPLRTVTGAHRGELALVAPLVARLRGTSPSHLDGTVSPANEELGTVSAQGTHHALIAPTLIQTGYGERAGQAPRALDLQKPLGVVMAGGQKHALVAAFLAKHYGGPNGNQVVGQDLRKTLGTVTARDHHSLIEVALGQGQPDQVRAFLLKYYGSDQDPKLREPMHTITTRARMGLVQVHGFDYQIVDICLRMLQPRELFLAQGFPPDYEIDFDVDGRRLTKTQQVRMVGNSVSPVIPKALVEANFAWAMEGVADARA